MKLIRIRTVQEEVFVNTDDFETAIDMIDGIDIEVSHTLQCTPWEIA